MPSFTDFVFDVTADNPSPTIYSLSAADNSIALLTTNGTLSGLTVTGILYNAPLSAGVATTILSAGTAAFKVHPYYNQTAAAALLSDGTSVLFTILSSTATQVMTSAPSVNPGPNERRLRALEVL